MKPINVPTMPVAPDGGDKLETSKTIRATNASMKIGWTATTMKWGMIGQRENTMTKVRRYSASGITHNSGTAATSVEMWAVTAINSPEGTAVRPTQISTS